MTDYSLSPWVRVLSSSIARFGELKTAAICYALFLAASLILSSMFYYVAIGELFLVDILAVVFFSAVVSPLIISVLINSIRQLDASYAYLDSATKQEKLLNQTLKDNISRLNIEIDERKMAFQAKHSAIEELLANKYGNEKLHNWRKELDDNVVECSKELDLVMQYQSE